MRLSSGPETTPANQSGCIADGNLTVAQHGFEDTPRAIRVGPGERLIVAGDFGMSGNQGFNGQGSGLMKIKLIFGGERVKAMGDGMLNAGGMNLEWSKGVVAAGGRRAMFPNAGGDLFVPLWPGVSRLGSDDRGVKGAGGEVDER